MDPDLSIVILSWNVRDLLAGCLRSLPQAAAQWWDRAEVLVVDNASTDGSAEMVRRDFPAVRLVPLPRNLGFSGGNNAGIMAARGKYVLLLNPDTVALPGSIASMAAYMEAHEEVGIVGPRLLNPDGTLQPSRRRFPTLLTALVESTPLQRWLGSMPAIRRFYMLDVPEGETQQVDWLSGAALLCRREALSQAGLFDPGYFMFSEEVDLCKRVKDAGWEIVYVPSAEIVHYGGQSTGQAVAARHIDFNTSKARYFRLHEGGTIGRLVRLYLLATYAVQTASEGAKWLLGHKRELRAERLRMYARVLGSGLRERRPRRERAGVLLVTGEYPPAQGGVGDYTCKLGQALETTGLRHQVLTRPAEAAPPGDITGAPVRRTRPGPFLSRRVDLRAVTRALRATGAPIAHIQYQTGAYEMRLTVNLLPWLLRSRWRGATVVTFHDVRVPYLFPKAGPVREWVNRLMARAADACIATNPEDAARIQSWGVKRLELVPIGSNIPNNPPPGYDRQAWRERWGADEGTTLVAYFGFLNSSKGLDDLLRALPQLRERGDYRLLMVGGGLGSSDPTDRDTASRLGELARQLGVEGSLIWTGYLEPREVSAALLCADMAVLPYADGASFRRGSLLAVLEHGLALVTTEPNLEIRIADFGFGGSWPSLVDGENALLVKVGDVEGIVEAVARLAGDDELRERLGRGAGELAGFFNWAAIAESHARLYRRLLGREM
ncbi:MAG TPA: glycosyltransferase [Chloroflexia bacterium]|nr:glycosyltransferase [Chloroflexia bacterium]